MLDRPLSPEEIQQLNASITQLKEHEASAKEDIEAGMPRQPQLDAIQQGIRTAEHILRKYGTVAPIRPRKRR
jgi:hypothetical protein